MKRYSRWEREALLAIACLLIAGRSLAFEPPLHLRLAGDLQPGEHAVGFRKETLRLDRRSTWAGAPTERFGELPEYLDLYLWYPATSRVRTSSGPTAMTLADYYRVQEPGTWDRPSLRHRLREDMTSPPELEDADLDRVLDTPMWAHAESDALPGPRPLVLWSYRDSIPTMQSVLNEFLASHGYVVAFAFPADNAPRLPWQEEMTEEAKESVLHTQVGVLEAALDSLKSRPWIDANRAAVLSWSYGGESANLLQRRRPEIQLALGIDSTLAGGGVFLSSKVWSELDRNELSVPYVLLRNGRPRLGGEERPAPPLLAEVPAGAWHVRFPALSHGNFNVPGGMIPGVLRLENVSQWAVGGGTARRGYELICRYALGFLDHYLGAGVLGSDPARWFATETGEVEIEHYVPTHPSLPGKEISPRLKLGSLSNLGSIGSNKGRVPLLAPPRWRDEFTPPSSNFSPIRWENALTALGQS